MATTNDFQKKLLATFRVEAAERLKTIVNGLLQLERGASGSHQAEVIEALFREVHSLKGAARAVSSSEIERICKSCEALFAALQRAGLTVSPTLMDLLHRVTAFTERLLANLGSTLSSEQSKMLDGMIGELDAALATGADSSTTVPPGMEQRPPASSAALGPSGETVRIAISKLDSLLLQAEELLGSKLSAIQRTAELHSLLNEFAAWKRKLTAAQKELHSLAHSTERNGNHDTVNANELLELLDSSFSFLAGFEQRLSAIAKSSSRDQRSLSSLVDSLLEDVKKAVMLPFATLLEAFPKLVRDLAHDQRKGVDLTVRGAEIEIDRRILERLKDPLIHLIRNCIDHGIEAPEERKSRGKASRGTIMISVAHRNGNKIEITVEDDGIGIDPDKVRATAARKGLFTETAPVSDAEALDLIFQSGFSTSAMLTDLSGRGLGLAIVRENVERLGGTVSVESTVGRGSTFRLILPLTLATFQGFLVQLDNQLFVLPAANIERVLRFRPDDIRTAENRETIVVNGEIVSLVRLADVLGMKRRNGLAPQSLQAVVLHAANKRMAFLVDVVVQEQEVLVKNLGPQLARLRNIAGATILGSGKVVPILNVPDLIKSAVRGAGAARPVPAAEVREEPIRRRSVLVVEDSITARTLLRTILESAGYSVVTAVDGIDALTQLRTSEFDIVVSDVDMPRMNGFDLTAKIRSEKKFADLPVVLVTALESREDRERGVEVGANAYIVKSSFDHSNLLDVVRRLV